MANKKLSQLSLISSFGPNSYVPIVDPDGSGATSRILVSDLLTGPTTPFDPTALPGLWGYFTDAGGSFWQNAALTTPAAVEGANINGWKRTTGGAVDLTNTINSQGFLRLNALNGKAVVQTASTTTLTADLSGGKGQGNWYALVAAKATALGTLQALLGFGDSASISNYTYLSICDTNVVGGGGTRFALNGMGAEVTDATVVGTAAYGIYEVGFDGTNARLRVNGGTWRTGAGSAFSAASKFGLGCIYRHGPATLGSFAGRIAGGWACDSWPDAGQLANSLAYAQTLWGL